MGLFILVVFSLVTAGVVYYFNLPVSKTDAAVHIIEIERGETLRSIAEKLEENNLIRSSLLFMIISRANGTEQQMRSGRYAVSKTMSSAEIHRLIVSGAALLYRVTIPEGSTASQIAAILEAANITDRDSFMEAVTNSDLPNRFNIPSHTLEGYLFPDSYLFPQNYPAERVVSHMVSTFFMRLAEIYPNYADLSPEELNDRVILASIVEREYRVAAEAPIMAGVFLNRLNIRMALGSCATIVYIITEILGRPHPTRITYADIAIDSDYNTYIRVGLPPAPISNPGEIALNAVFFPADTDYLFFLLRNSATGEHFFSRTLAEHNMGRVRYLQR
ncbi:MAG: endolytic transglycosylase MltG [Spirochaetes bacterium]|nr:endolytic transglycosylase MltG [Spirochaetota bacterium]